jgi:membrane protease subunit HflK
MSPGAVIKALATRGAGAIKARRILDEAFKKLQQRIAGMFGGGRGGSGPAKGGALRRSVGVVLGGCLLVWGLMGFYQLDEQERAVVLRFGEYHCHADAGSAVESAAH